MRRFLICCLLCVTVCVAGSVPGAIAPAHAAADAAEGDHHESGVPGFQRDLALWSLVVFLLFMFVLKKMAWGPIVEGLDRRESKVRQDIADAEAARVKAEQMLAEHAAKLEHVQDEVREILAEARRDAEYTKNDIVSTAQREAETTRQRAIGEINRARDQALKELFDSMSAQVADATEHVLGRALSDADQDRFITEALAQFSERPD